jgi:hypothetical protein
MSNITVEVVKLRNPELIRTVMGVQDRRVVSEEEAKEMGLVWGEDRIARVADLYE